jgi:hypothetical protein
MFNDAALIFGATLERRLVDLGQPGLARHFQKIRPKRRGEGQDHARIVHVFVDQFVVHPRAMAQQRLARHQRRLREGIVEVIENERRLDDGFAVVHERRHDAIGIEFAIGRIVLTAAQRQQVFLNLETLFGKGNPHFLRTDRIDVVIMFEHAALPNVVRVRSRS